MTAAAVTKNAAAVIGDIRYKYLSGEDINEVSAKGIETDLMKMNEEEIIMAEDVNSPNCTAYFLRG